MVTESGLKIRVALDSVKMLKVTTNSRTAHNAGDIIMVNGLVGVVVENVGPDSDFVLVYEAEKIVVPKVAGMMSAIQKGQRVVVEYGTMKVKSGPCAGQLCGIALEDAGDFDEEVLIDLMVMG